MIRLVPWRSVLLSVASVASALALAACGSSAPPARPAIQTVPASASPAPAAGLAGSQRLPAPATIAPTATPAATLPSEAPGSPTPEETATVQAAVPTVAVIPTLPPIEHIDALALGGATPVRSAPSMIDGQTVATLADRQPIVIQREVRGQRWVVGDQTWAMAIQDWSNLWYQIDGGYVYAGFVYIPRPGELNSLADTSAEHWVDVDLTTQTARAMIGDQAVMTAAITSGKPGFETPVGEHAIEPWGRKFNETMTSTQAGIKDPQNQYDVHNVLYTQYFDTEGDALHLNYWQPAGVFGSQRTSHGCVGLQLHDAEYFWLFARPGTRVVIRPLPVTGTPTAAASAAPTRTAPVAVTPSTTPPSAPASVSPRATSVPPTATP
jgi:hypothetical protein